MSGVTRDDRIKKACVRCVIRVASIVNSMRENRLKWFGRVMRKQETEAVRVVMEIVVQGKSGRERPKRDGWIRLSDMRAVGVFVGDAED